MFPQGVCRFPIALLVICGLWSNLFGAATPTKVAVLDFQDKFTSTKGLGELLTDIGQPFTDKTKQSQDGQPIDLTGFDTFILGSFCTEDNSIRGALADAGKTLGEFVKNGGTVIVLTQADQTVAQESWVPRPARIGRADPDFDAVCRVQPDHSIFASPNAIADADLRDWRYVGGGGKTTWITSWESLATFEGAGVLAGNHPTDVELSAIVEVGWGRGRALFLSLAPDKARNIGNDQAKAQAPRMMQNLLKYAENVKAGAARPVQIHKGVTGRAGPITGRVFNDVNCDGKWNEGDSGIRGVGVSDTIDLALSSDDGTYTLPNPAKNARLIYVCLPAGFSKASRWFTHVDSSSTDAAVDFPLTSADESGPFDFVQVSDVHIRGGDSTPLYVDALASIASLKQRPAVVVATGDLADVGSNHTHFRDYVKAVSTSKVPVFNVFGNHDANEGGSSNYRKYLGPDYYSFDYGDCHFLMLNSVHKTPQQKAWIEQDMKLLRGKKRLFIFQHFSPSEEEHVQFYTLSATAVFSGHWHSQHTVAVNEMTSYNIGTLLFGGIDCSPAGFKIIHVTDTGISTRTRWVADGKRLKIVTPSASTLVGAGEIQILVNAYETAADITSMRYEVRQGATVAAEGILAPQGDWNWKASVPAGKLAQGDYELQVTATNDVAAANTATTSFKVTGLHKTPPTTRPDWPQFGGGPQRGGFVDSELKPPLGLLWSRHTGGTIDFASPVIKSNILYMGVKDRQDFAQNGVMALSAEDGARLWFAKTPAAVSHSVAVDDARVYATSHGGLLHAFDRSDGKPAWPANVLGSAVQRFQYSGPVLVDDRLYAGTFAYFAAFNAASGAKNWNQTYGADWISSNACPAVKNDIVLVPANGNANSLRAVRATDGSKLWEYQVRGLHGSPVIANDKVLFTDWSGSLHCADLNTGAPVWRPRSLGGGRSACTPAVAHGIVVTGGAGSIRGYQLASGQQLWEVPIETSALRMAPYNNTFVALVGSPTIADRIAYVPCGDGKLYAIGIATGQVQWSMDFGAPILSAPCIAGNTMFLSTFDGNLYALADRSGYRPSPAVSE